MIYASDVSYLFFSNYFSLVTKMLKIPLLKTSLFSGIFLKIENYSAWGEMTFFREGFSRREWG